MLLLHRGRVAMHRPIRDLEEHGLELSVRGIEALAEFMGIDRTTPTQAAG